MHTSDEEDDSNRETHQPMVTTGPKKRYKRYLDAETENDVVPRTTAWRHRKLQQSLEITEGNADESSTSNFEETEVNFIDDIEESDSGGERPAAENDDTPEIIGDEDDEDRDIFEDAIDEEAAPDEGAEHFSEYSNKLHDRSDITYGEALVATFSFIMKNKLSDSAIVHLMSLLNLLLGQQWFPRSKYLFEKIFIDSMPFARYHFFCVHCESYLASFEKNGNHVSGLCPDCSHPYNSDNLNSGNFFITISMEKQLKALLEDSKIQDLMEQYRETMDRNNADSFCDILSGDICKQVDEGFLRNECNFSYTFNTDGAQVFESSAYSVWPLFISLNQLPPKQRYENIQMVGLWFGTSAPNMNVYLEQFVNDANDLHTKGISWKNKSGIVKNSKFLPICCAVDSSARCKLLNMKQFNGYFACPWCYHPGTSVDTGVKNEIRYPVMEEDFGLRSGDEAVADMALAVQDNRTVRGFKGSSILINLPKFDIVKQTSPDYMHCVLLGVVKRTTLHWLDDANQPYYIGTESNKRKIENRIKCIKPPCNVPRFTRKLKYRMYWKASEWRLWVLFYFLPCLTGILSDTYLSHFKLLSEGLFMLLQASITREEISRADAKLFQFVCGMQMLYGDKFSVYNVHLLTHLGQAAILLGPLWAHSLFSFENANGKLLSLVKGPAGVPQQCAKRYIMNIALTPFINQNNITLSKEIQSYIDKIAGLRNRAEVFQFNGTTVLGKGYLAELSLPEQEALVGFCLVETNVLQYDRAIVNGIVMTTDAYSAKKKSQNSFFHMESLVVGRIEKILTAIDMEGNRSIFFLYQRVRFQANRDNVPQHIQEISFIDHVISAISCNHIEGKCVALFNGTDTYISKFPNPYERD